jgi:hypothetical protein
MQRVLAEVPEARILIEAVLLRPLGNGGGGSESTGGLKRKATEECKNCKQFYQIEDNNKGACRYHPCKFLNGYHRCLCIPPLAPSILLTSVLLFALLAEPEVDDESATWEDHDPDCHGDPEDLMDDPTYEDGYIMGCCDKRMNASGCVVSRHKPKVDALGSKRMKI